MDPAARSEYRPRFLRFCTRLAARRFRFALNRIFRHQQWNIGVMRTPVSRLLCANGMSDAPIDWFPLNHRRGFLADPFGIMRAGTTHILCEYFGYREGAGRICALEFSENGFVKQPERAITLPVHVSYPFLIEEALFQAVEFPRKWTKLAVLLEGFRGVDPTVFRHDERWWLLCTERGPYVDASLWAWHAPRLLGPWTPHLRNPIKTDVRSARPGGAPFVHGGMLYRPAQDCSQTYGGRIVIHRVNRLTPSDFEEEAVTAIEPSPDSPFPQGRHTLTPLGDVVLIDGHRTIFSWSALRLFLEICTRQFARNFRPTGQSSG